MKAYTFKVSLFHAKRIYRRIICLEDQTLDDLHDAIFSAFDRYDEHLYSFYFPHKSTQSLRIICNANKISHPGALDDYSQNNQHDASKVEIGTLCLVEKQKFYYLFDYGDKWWHELTFEGVKEYENHDCPAVILKKGESPGQYPEIDEDSDFA